ncbi:hypothetical protein [Anaeromyxobacter oryzae]|uniref:Uncharacterized protein n=1 Tax=Anaeromyxobacter oryzae TaxID=2918170 RepID=A0ABM7WW97_9BACT|nr:hypothetical protein [Anaeromyxobacter oryzae]BDG03768.1 hypothetical protein AMOR_27640 [Anaeromyxobacter oryzae]
MKPKRVAAAAFLGAAVLGGVAYAFLRGDVAAAHPAPPHAPVAPEPPASPPPIDASRIQTGRLSFSRMPEEVTGALEVHSAEIVKTAEALATKQARIVGTCAPGSAIRVVGEDGSVVCQKLPRGVVSVSALNGLPRVATTTTAQQSVPGGVGRYQSGGEDDFLVVPVTLPDGAIVTGFSYVFWDAAAKVDGGAYLYRSDDTAMAAVATEGANEEVRIVSTEEIQARRVDNSAYAYFVYMQMSAQAGQNLMPIAASVAYRLP